MLHPVLLLYIEVLGGGGGAVLALRERVSRQILSMISPRRKGMGRKPRSLFQLL